MIMTSSISLSVYSNRQMALTKNHIQIHIQITFKLMRKQKSHQSTLDHQIKAHHLVIKQTPEDQQHGVLSDENLFQPSGSFWVQLSFQPSTAQASGGPIILCEGSHMSWVHGNTSLTSDNYVTLPHDHLNPFIGSRYPNNGLFQQNNAQIAQNLFSIYGTEWRSLFACKILHLQLSGNWRQLQMSSNLS